MLRTVKLIERQVRINWYYTFSHSSRTRGLTSHEIEQGRAAARQTRWYRSPFFACQVMVQGTIWRRSQDIDSARVGAMVRRPRHPTRAHVPQNQAGPYTLVDEAP